MFKYTSVNLTVTEKISKQIDKCVVKTLPSKACLLDFKGVILFHILFIFLKLDFF